MSTHRPTVEYVPTADIPDPLPAAIVRPRPHVQAIRAQSLLEMGTNGRTALAWDWALTGTRPSPVTLSIAPGSPPTRDQIRAEAAAPPEGSTAAPGVPTDFCDQLAEARRVLAWLAGSTDEIPVDDDNRGRFIGARDDYARTDDDIRQLRDHTRISLAAHEWPEIMTPDDTSSPRQSDADRMEAAAWLRGVHDLLDWILGERPATPLCHRTVQLPTVDDLTFEENAADELVAQSHSDSPLADSASKTALQYAEAVQATIHWLRGEATTPPVDHEGRGSY
jgi:hypothetical protein